MFKKKVLIVAALVVASRFAVLADVPQDTLAATADYKLAVFYLEGHVHQAAQWGLVWRKLPVGKVRIKVAAVLPRARRSSSHRVSPARAVFRPDRMSRSERTERQRAPSLGVQIDVL